MLFPIVKRKFEWKIENISKENVQIKYDTPQIQIYCGEFMTKWSFVFFTRITSQTNHLWVYKHSIDCNYFDGHFRAMVKNRAVCFLDLPTTETKKWAEFFKTEDLFDESFLENGTLTIHIDIEVKQVKEVPAVPDLCFFNDELYSDFQLISSDNKVFPIHRVIVAAKSPKLKIFIDKFAEQKKIILEDIDGSTLFELLKFIYTAEINYNWENILSLLKAATYYNEALKQKCVTYLINNLSIENIFEVLICAEESNEHCLKFECIKFIKNNYFQLRIQRQKDFDDLDKKFLYLIMDSIEMENSSIIKYTSK
ncbi:hypothetical protein PVAND_000668 [Polypedilum vanderplanki]|uniref:BTB domain-containing protein n=1 Tax=Polypedilum vanderplanki TaxID=319348 RepID=A0A9J6BL11_POLVA|nr:hypothetical protein PVAND_000668 [Polypedilum vanderplanki]